MTDLLDGVRDHYRATGLTERLKTALKTFGAEEQRLAPSQLATLDQFHTRGLAATTELAKLASDYRRLCSVLDVRIGHWRAGAVSGRVPMAARLRASTSANHSSMPRRYLTERTGQNGQVSFQTASALELPFDDGGFDVAVLQHVAMNISDRARLYREILRVLKSGGKFATFDVVLNSGDPHYPVPLGTDAGHELSPDTAATREAIRSAGFRTLAWSMNGLSKPAKCLDRASARAVRTAEFEETSAR